MSQRSSDLVLGISGVASFVGFVVGFGILVGMVPGPAAGAEDVREFLARSETRIWMGGYIGLLGLIAFMIFAAVLCRTLREAEDSHAWLSTLAFGAVVAQTGATIAGDLLPGATAFYGGSRVDPATVSLLLDQKKLAEVLTVPLMGLFLGCAAIVILRANAMPRWVGWSAAAVAATSLIAVPFGFDAVQIPALLTALWMLAVSVRALVRSARAPRASAVRRTA